MKKIKGNKVWYKLDKEFYEDEQHRMELFEMQHNYVIEHKPTFNWLCTKGDNNEQT